MDKWVCWLGQLQYILFVCHFLAYLYWHYIVNSCEIFLLQKVLNLNILMLIGLKINFLLKLRKRTRSNMVPVFVNINANIIIIFPIFTDNLIFCANNEHYSRQDNSRKIQRSKKLYRIIFTK